MTEKIEKLQQLIMEISYPADSDRSVRDMLDEAEELATDIYFEQIEMGKRIDKLMNN